MTQKNAMWSLLILSIISSIVSYFLFDRSKEDWFFSYWGVIGTNLSVFGLAFTIAQISTLRKESDIIKSAINETKDKINNLNQIGSIATAIKLIQEIQGYCRMHRYESAVMRLQELKLIIGHMVVADLILTKPFDRDQIIISLNMHINGMEKGLVSKTNSIQPANVNKSLETVSDFLIEIQAKTRNRS